MSLRLGGLRLVKGGSDQWDGSRYPWQPWEWPPPNAWSH